MMPQASKNLGSLRSYTRTHELLCDTFVLLFWMRFAGGVFRSVSEKMRFGAFQPAQATECSCDDMLITMAQAVAAVMRRL